VTQLESYSSGRPASSGHPPRPRSRSSYEHAVRDLGPPAPAPDDDLPAGPVPGRRGSHATGRGQGFGWVLGWTIAGALLPGSALIAAGRRGVGAAVLAVLGLAAAALVALAGFGDSRRRVIELAVDPQSLLLVAAGAATIGLLWAAVVVLSHVSLRHFADLTRPERAFSALVVAALAVGVAMPAYKVGDYALIQRDLVKGLFDEEAKDPGTTSSGPAVEKKDPWAGVPRVNVLLIGSDAGKGRVGVRPDTMIVASIDTASGDTVLFSLPRNLERAPFPTGTPGHDAWPNGFDCGDECLLNAVWTWAESSSYYRGKRHPGLEATEDAIEGVTGLKINTYAMLNLKGFAQFVNALGGVRVNVDQRLPIGGNSEHPEQTTGYIKAGRNRLLRGYEALWFARSRWSTNDFDRMRRQRCVIGAVVEQSDPVKMALAFPAIAKAAKDNISTGIPQRDLQAWVELSQKVQGASVRSLPFTDQVISNRANPDFDQIHSLVGKALRPVSTSTPEPSIRPSPSTTPPKGTKKTTIDPSKAQDVNEVC
jgi:polyisoprenyl-teichoic acid--peptidoglycan teichoic acid transferase